MSTPFNWEFIKASKPDVRLDLLGVEPTLICNNFYKLGLQEYAIVNKVKLRSPGSSEDLLGTIFYWAPSLGMALRAVWQDISQDEGGVVQPPPTLLIDGWRWSYQDILDACSGGQLGPHRAAQRDLDHFIWRVIKVGLFTYYFRDRNDPLEKAFAVGVDIRGIRWGLTD